MSHDFPNGDTCHFNVSDVNCSQVLTNFIFTSSGKARKRIYKLGLASASKSMNRPGDDNSIKHPFRLATQLYQSRQEIKGPDGSTVNSPTQPDKQTALFVRPLFDKDRLSVRKVSPYSSLSAPEDSGLPAPAPAPAPAPGSGSGSGSGRRLMELSASAE